MGALGDKIGFSLIAQAAEVPTLPWSGSHVKLSPESCLITIPEDVYRQACVYTTEEADASCQDVGYPAMIKASWGGGGKGIRKVHNDDEVRALFKQVHGEVPGSPVFIMKLSELHQLMIEAARILNIEAPDLYVRQSPVPNAYTLAVNGKKPFVVVHTRLVQLLTRKELQRSVASSGKKATIRFVELKRRRYWYPLMIGIGLLVLQQLSGINGVLFYSTNIFESAGVSSGNVATFGLGAIQVIATGVTMWLTDKAGRRLLLIISSAMMNVSHPCCRCIFLKDLLSPNSHLHNSLWILSLVGLVGLDDGESVLEMVSCRFGI